VVEETLPDDHIPILGPVRVEIDLFLTRPPSIKRSKREFPIVPPDIDKICRGILDGLNQGPDGKANNGRLWADDSIVVELLARKFYADDRPPGAIIKVIEI
jgi:Holliday junction resolvase RusA-like endonuclease